MKGLVFLRYLFFSHIQNKIPAPHARLCCRTCGPRSTPRCRGILRRHAGRPTHIAWSLKHLFVDTRYARTVNEQNQRLTGVVSEGFLDRL